MSDYFDEIFANFDEQRAVEAVAKADGAAAKAQAEADSQRRILEAYRTWRALHENSITMKPGDMLEPLEPGRVRRALKGNADSPTGRNSIRRLMERHSPNKSWTIPTIAKALDLPSDAHGRLGMSLQRLARDGEVRRTRKGVYKLPPATVTAGAGEGREATSDNGSQNGSGDAVRSSELFGLAGRAPGAESGSSG